MLEKAMRLCGAAFGQFHSFDGERFHTAALRGMPPRYAEYRGQTEPSYGPGTGPARILGGERVVHVADMAESEAYRSGDPARRARRSGRLPHLVVRRPIPGRQAARSGFALPSRSSPVL